MEGVLVQDDFDNLAAPEVGIAAQSESIFGGIQNQAGQSFLVTVEVDDETGTRFGEAALERRPSGMGKLGIVCPIEVVSAQPESLHSGTRGAAPASGIERAGWELRAARP